MPRKNDPRHGPVIIFSSRLVLILLNVAVRHELRGFDNTCSAVIIRSFAAGNAAMGSRIVIRTALSSKTE